MTPFSVLMQCKGNFPVRSINLWGRGDLVDGNGGRAGLAGGGSGGEGKNGKGFGNRPWCR